LGLTQPSDELKVIRGVKPYIEFKEAFDSLLSQK
jgi:hypothetical protein